MQSNTNMLVAGATLLAIILCTTYLVAQDKLAADLYVGVVIGPAVGGLIAYISHSKGVAQGSEASSDPPAEA
jgi:hypothetical protein